jgi:hypothetical protein
MRMMMMAVLDTEAGNEALRNGSMITTVEQMMNQLKPEAAYFAAPAGQRSCFVVFDMADPSQIPAIVEPLFVGAKATVTLSPCMNLEDLQKGLSQLSPEVTSR